MRSQKRLKADILHTHTLFPSFFLWEKDLIRVFSPASSPPPPFFVKSQNFARNGRRRRRRKRPFIDLKCRFARRKRNFFPSPIFFEEREGKNFSTFPVFCQFFFFNFYFCSFLILDHITVVRKKGGGGKRGPLHALIRT